MRRLDDHQYERVDFVAKQYFQLLMTHQPNSSIVAFLRSPVGKQYRERFQAFAFMRGIQFVTKRLWYMRILEDDPPDMEAISPKPSPEIYVAVENVSITKHSIKETKNFSLYGIAAFLKKKKPPYKLGEKTILAAYLDAELQIEDIAELGRLVQEEYNSSHEIWIHGACDPSREQWFVQRLSPDCLPQAFYALWPPDATMAAAPRPARPPQG